MVIHLTSSYRSRICAHGIWSGVGDFPPLSQTRKPAVTFAGGKYSWLCETTSSFFLSLLSLSISYCTAWGEEVRTICPSCTDDPSSRIP